MEMIGTAYAYEAYAIAHDLELETADFNDLKLSLDGKWLSYLGIFVLVGQLLSSTMAIANTVNTNSGCLNVRESPSTSGKIVTCLPKGTSLAKIVREQNGWYQLETGRWVSKQYVATSPAPIPSNASSSATSTNATSTCLNIRSSPDGDIVDCMLDGKVLPDIVKEENGWYQLRTGNWVAKNHVEWQQPTVSLASNKQLVSSKPINNGSATATTTMRYVRGNPLTGPEITRLQTKLNYYKLLENPIAVDGVFGKETELAVLSFQGKRGLLKDGIVGPATSNALNM